MSNERDCEHGSLRRSCLVCELTTTTQSTLTASEALRERVRALEAEVATFKRYTDGGYRDEPCVCGLVSLRWYRHCPRCGTLLADAKL